MARCQKSYVKYQMERENRDGNARNSRLATKNKFTARRTQPPQHTYSMRSSRGGDRNKTWNMAVFRAPSYLNTTLTEYNTSAPRHEFLCAMPYRRTSQDRSGKKIERSPSVPVVFGNLVDVHLLYSASTLYESSTHPSTQARCVSVWWPIVFYSLCETEPAFLNRFNSTLRANPHVVGHRETGEH